MMVTAGAAADLDYLSYFGGPEDFLRFHRGLLHSIAGGVVIAGATAGVFCALDRRRRGSEFDAEKAKPLGFLAAFIASGIGAAGHMALDMASGTGVQLFWPFDVHLYAWNLLTNLDLWILIALLAGLLLPLLLGLVSEEIGDRKKRVRGRMGAGLALAAIVVYIGARAALHKEAVELVMSHEYRRQVALSGDVFPLSSSSLPFDWRGVVVTDNTVEEINFTVGHQEKFDPDRSVTHYKPDDTAALRAGQQAEVTQLYLRYARFPLAYVGQQEDGWRFELHDLQFSFADAIPDNIFVRVDLDSSMRITRQQFLFASNPNP